MSGNGCGEHISYIISRRCNLKEIGICKVVSEEKAGSLYQVVVCRMTLEIKKKRVKAEKRIKWWKLKKEEC